MPPDHLFFVLALGRSGTKFLTRLLATDPRATVVHELPQDAYLLSLRYAGSMNQVVDGMLARRFEDSLSGVSTPIYGEVNSYLRYETDWLTEQFSPVLIHLARDGRDVVRSAYPRPVYTPHEGQPPVVPKDTDPAAAKWTSMSRFEKLCWYWNHTNRMLRDRVPLLVRLEDILDDYDYFKSQLADRIGVQVPHAVWEAERGRPRNSSKVYRARQAAKTMLSRGSLPSPLPHWREWSEELTSTFWDINGELMDELGYSR